VMTDFEQGAGFSLVHPAEEAKSNASSAMAVVIYQRDQARHKVEELQAWQQVARENYEDLRIKYDARLDLLAKADAGLTEAWAAFARAEQRIASAPHAVSCSSVVDFVESVCDCWKSEATA